MNWKGLTRLVFAAETIIGVLCSFTIRCCIAVTRFCLSIQENFCLQILSHHAVFDSDNVADLFTKTRLLTCFFIKRKQRYKVQAQITSSSAVTRGAFALGLRPLNCPRRRTSSLATGFTQSSKKGKLLMDWSYELKRSHNVSDHEWTLSVSFFFFLGHLHKPFQIFFLN